MALYEHVFMARQDVTAQQVEALTEQLKGILTGRGGKIAKSE
jgi:small subunit ribosomal protein S6